MVSPVAAIRAIFFVDGFIIAKWLPHLPDLKAQFGLGLADLGFALAALPAGILCMLPLAGALVGRGTERGTVAATFCWLAVTSAAPGLGHRLISPQPDAGCCEFDDGEVVRGMFFVSGRDGPEVFDLAEEAFDEVPVAVEEWAEGGRVEPSR